jgi:hypothetical protein
LAIKNGIKEENYIVIDCRKSELEWIKDNDYGVLNSRLNEIFDLNIIDWNKANEFALSSRVREACDLWNEKYDVTDISKKMKLGKETIRRYLNKGVKIGLCTYNSKQEMLKGSRNGYMKKCIKIICLNNLEVFNSVSDAGRKYGISISGINQCCKNNYKYNYLYSKIEDENFVFTYYEEYLKMTKEDIENKLKYIHNKKNRTGVKTPVICLNTLEVFDSAKDAMRKYMISEKGSGIARACKGERGTCGKHPITKEKLSWMYYKDYLKLENKNEIKSKIEKIYCITLNKIFDTLNEASQYTKVKDKYSINKCCKGKVTYAGKSEQGIPLKWMYYKDYIKQQSIHNENLGQAI